MWLVISFFGDPLPSLRFATATMSSGVPAATTVPPSWPASGPMSITQSADLTTSRLCSIRTTVLPKSTRRCKHFEQLGQIVEMQSGRRFVQQIQSAPGIRPSEFCGQLDPLRLAAGERRCGLSERQIIQTNVAQRLQNAANLGNVLEQLDRFAARHIQHVADRATVVRDRQGFGVVPRTTTRIARYPHVGQEVHFDAQLSIAFTAVATSARRR